MTDPLERVEKALEMLSEGPFGAFRMTKGGGDMTRADLLEYFANTIDVSYRKSGSADFFFVSCEKEDGPADVCHTGNGPNSWPNAHGIATLRNEVPALVKELRARRADKPYEDAERDRLAEHVAQLKALQSGGVWLWQGDEHDDVDSLACPVLMSADQARTLVAELKRLREERDAEIPEAPSDNACKSFLIDYYGETPDFTLGNVVTLMRIAWAAGAMRQSWEQKQEDPQ